MGTPEPKPDPRRRPLEAAPEAAVRRRAPSDGVAPADAASLEGRRGAGASIEPESVMLENLLEEGEWLRSVALAITRDPNLADDIVQNTYLAAMRSPPRDPAKRRAWLRTVVKNFARLAYREGSRRSTRERATARAEAIPSAEDLVDQDELHGLVAETVSGLREPYRSTVIDHYYRGRTSQEIADELGLPANTVRVRLRRAVKQLGETLDGVCDGKRALWAIPLVGLFLTSEEIEAAIVARGLSLDPTRAHVPPTEPGALDAGTSVASLAKSLVTAAGVIALLWFVLPDAPSPADPAARTADRGTNAPSANTAHTSTIGRSRLDTVPVGPPPSAIGRVPASVGPPSIPATDPTGPRAATESAPANPAFAPTPHSVRIIDRATGAPILGASLLTEPFAMRSERMARGRTRLEYLMLPFARDLAGRTGADGRLDVDPERLALERILVRAPGYAEFRERERLRVSPDRTLTIALDRAPEGSIAVEFADGSPVRRVPLTLRTPSGGEITGATDAAGRYFFDVEEAAAAVEIDLPGFASVHALALPDRTIVLVPAPEHALTITDPTGRALADTAVELRLPDRTVLHRTTDPRGTLTFGARATGTATVIVRHPEFPVRRAEVALGSPADSEDGSASSSETATNGVRATVALEKPCWIEGTLTSRAGAIPGGTVLRLVDLPFMVRDLATATILPGVPRADGTATAHFRIGPLPAGTPVTLRVEPQGCAPVERTIDAVAPYSTAAVALDCAPGRTLTGRFVTPDGTPVPGVRVRAGTIVGDELRGPLAMSDADGTFTLTGLPPEAPPVRATLAEPRWAALGDPGDLPATGAVLQVLAPHQLLAAGGADVPRSFFLGSRNTIPLPADPGTGAIELVVEPWPTRRVPPLALRDPDGFPVRDVLNWTIHPPEDPSDVSAIFAGTDGAPVRMEDPTPLEGAWITFHPEEHAVAGGVFGLADQIESDALLGGDPPWVVTLWPRVGRTLVLRHDDGAAATDLDLWWVPDDPRAFLAIALGRTDRDGRLVVDRLPPGRFALLATRPAESAPRPFRDAIAREDGTAVGVLSIPRSSGIATGSHAQDRVLEVRIDRLPPAGDGADEGSE